MIQASKTRPRTSCTRTICPAERPDDAGTRTVQGV